MYNLTYGRGIPYETFMRRALKCLERSKRKGTCGSIYEYLIQLEEGAALKKVNPQTQLERVKKCLEKGFRTFLKRNLKPEERQTLEYLLVKLHSAYHSNDLNVIISRALDITQPYRDY